MLESTYYFKRGSHYQHCDAVFPGEASTTYCYSMYVICYLHHLNPFHSKLLSDSLPIHSEITNYKYFLPALVTNTRRPITQCTKF